MLCNLFLNLIFIKKLTINIQRANVLIWTSTESGASLGTDPGWGALVMFCWNQLPLVWSVWGWTVGPTGMWWRSGQLSSWSSLGTHTLKSLPMLCVYPWAAGVQLAIYIFFCSGLLYLYIPEDGSHLKLSFTLNNSLQYFCFQTITLFTPVQWHSPNKLTRQEVA